ncbi:fatty acid desaturase family protein [Jiella sp. MQZ9-1]|uniref:Fatty acid desaturase family protein n=1 Tax=Jiella flava TaxID=2816857 RepID=A0A939G0J7_9HYPH|nr:fatty acid desaturase family protein [Jiella flava]MBO0664269.1 fatty acid desaturase family protein [Jiella flava]MCD2472808.1 fatty acid desaturase family protein [Jiella flava]
MSLIADSPEAGALDAVPLRPRRSTRRDYSLVGEEGQQAVEIGLASAQWYHSDVPRKQMKELMKREDGPAIRDTAIWIGSMVAFAGIAAWLYPSLWSIPFFLAYGTLYGSASDSRWHECGHGTAFKTRWMNDWVYQIASFMMIRNPVVWRWSHTRHHTDTVIVGRDPEIVFMRPVEAMKVALNFVGILDTWHGLKSMVVNTFGGLSEEEKTFVPEMEWSRAIKIARIWFAIYAATVALAIATQSFLPLLLVGLPRMYGAWHGVMTGLLQHGGLAEDVIDHRLNSRTVYMNPVSRFIYWNMNYHVEHHMFPMVPYHALPRLHALIKHDLPRANTSIFDGYREMWPAVRRQMKNEDYFLKRELPATAKPYRGEFHEVEPGLRAKAA